MRVDYHRNFIKNLVKLPLNIRQTFHRKLKVFIENKFNQILDNHQLHGEFLGCRSINITGDYRAIFVEDNDVATFLRIGTHHQLFGR
ncbi:MAG: type II toxin-antitoxin system RelE/ParE family toxin [Patescibacteria group bacterium]